MLSSHFRHALQWGIIMTKVTPIGVHIKTCMVKGAIARVPHTTGNEIHDQDHMDLAHMRCVMYMRLVSMAIRVRTAPVMPEMEVMASLEAEGERDTTQVRCPIAFACGFDQFIYQVLGLRLT